MKLVARPWIVTIALCVWLAGAAAYAAAPEGAPAAESAKLYAIADEIYSWRIEREPGMRLRKGLPVTKLPRIDEASVREAAQFARGMLTRLESLDASTLPHDDELFRQSLVHAMTVDADAERFHWLVFLVTPYQGGDVHQLVFQVLAAQQLGSPAEVDRYAALLHDYGRILDEMRAKTIEQRRRGILLPKVAIAGAIALCEQLKAGSQRALVPSPERLAALGTQSGAQAKARLEKLVAAEIAPRIERLRAVFRPQYVSAAPEAVGLAQYPGGADFYRHLIRSYIGLDLEPEVIHDIGTRALIEIDARLADIRAKAGFTGTREAFNASLKTDPRWLASKPEDVEARYMSFVRRIEPHLRDYFSRLPKAPYGVKRLDPAAEPGMTYGYYQPPSASEPSGYYRYNGSGLATRTLIGAQHLIYHELVPGHHFQIALEQESANLHPLRAFVSSSAYVEGWAEYAAGLAEDMQLYEPMDLYGHLMMRSFIATRLVVDTGLNAKGWSLQRAREAMRHGTLEADAQIESELLRYSTDIPAQALSYYLGYDRIRELRTRAQRELGAAFDIRAFDDAVLAAGAVPLNVLDSHVDWFIGEARRSASALSSQHIASVATVKLRIARPPGVVWAALFDRNAWMPAFVSKQLVRGVEGAVGEETLNEMRDPSGRTGRRLEEILVSTPPERLVIRLAPPDGHGTSAVGEYRLGKSGRGTQLEFNVYWWEDIDAPLSPEHLQALEDEYSRQTEVKVRGDLERLKQHLEARR